MLIFIEISQLLVIINSASNILIYFVVSPRFRQSLTNTVMCRNQPQGDYCSVTENVDMMEMREVEESIIS